VPLGTFLDTLPTSLFVVAHVAFLALGLWTVRRVGVVGWGAALWLYAVSQIFFLAFFGGVLTMKMAVLIEQALLAGMMFSVGLTQKS
jgi:hypothetical protein